MTSLNLNIVQTHSQWRIRILKCEVWWGGVHNLGYNTQRFIVLFMVHNEIKPVLLLLHLSPPFSH